MKSLPRPNPSDGARCDPAAGPKPSLRGGGPPGLRPVPHRAGALGPAAAEDRGIASIPSMATTSYVQELAGSMVAAAAFDDDDAAVSAVTLLRESGMHEHDISVIPRDRRRAELIAGDRAWLPGKDWGGLMARLQRVRSGGVPKDVVARYKKALRSG